MQVKHATADNFEATLEELVGSPIRKFDKNLVRVVRKSGKAGLEEVSELSQSTFRHRRNNPRYVQGWHLRVESANREYPVAIIHNKDVPGLPHLLEKGHAKVGGGRVAGKSHIKIAAEVTFDTFEDEVKKAINKCF